MQPGCCLCVAGTLNGSLQARAAVCHKSRKLVPYLVVFPPVKANEIMSDDTLLFYDAQCMARR
jgi:hypothetical protein